MQRKDVASLVMQTIPTYMMHADVPWVFTAEIKWQDQNKKLLGNFQVKGSQQHTEYIMACLICDFNGR